MCPTRKSSLFQDLFGEGVPLWQKLLTLVTFPIWGPFVAATALFIAAFFGFIWCISIGGVLACSILDNISDK